MVGEVFMSKNHQIIIVIFCVIDMKMKKIAVFLQFVYDLYTVHEQSLEKSTLFVYNSIMRVEEYLP